jgi:PhnB protein
MNTKPIPDGYDALIPSFVVKDANGAIEFYRNVFGATEVMRLLYPGGGKVAHAEIKIRDHVLMLGDECPEMGVVAPAANAGHPPSSVMLYVEDVDRIYSRALAQGARTVMPPADMFWGDRYAKFVDPFGHLWGVATKLREVSPEECERAMAEWSPEPKPAAAAA